MDWRSGCKLDRDWGHAQAVDWDGRPDMTQRMGQGALVVARYGVAQVLVRAMLGQGAWAEAQHGMVHDKVLYLHRAYKLELFSHKKKKKAKGATFFLEILWLRWMEVDNSKLQVFVPKCLEHGAGAGALKR